MSPSGCSPQQFTDMSVGQRLELFPVPGTADRSMFEPGPHWRWLAPLRELVERLSASSCLAASWEVDPAPLNDSNWIWVVQLSRW